MRKITIRKKFTSIAVITALAASSSQALADQYDECAKTVELDYIAVDVGTASSL